MAGPPRFCGSDGKTAWVSTERWPAAMCGVSGNHRRAADYCARHRAAGMVFRGSPARDGAGILGSQRPGDGFAACGGVGDHRIASRGFAAGLGRRRHGASRAFHAGIPMRRRTRNPTRWNGAIGGFSRGFTAKPWRDCGGKFSRWASMFSSAILARHQGMIPRLPPGGKQRAI